jgi:hypothetical protein
LQVATTTQSQNIFDNLNKDNVGQIRPNLNRFFLPRSECTQIFLIVYNTLEMSHIPILIIHSIPKFANCMQEKLGTIDLVATSREYNSMII